jgi:HEPN domain-containing protein
MGIDVAKQVDYWRNGSQEDLAAAMSLADKGHIRHALFFAHLSLEKMLKAHVCRVTGTPPPRMHNLILLAERSRLALKQEQMEFLADVDRFNLAGRYPDARTPALPEAEAKAILAQTAEVLECLKQRLLP